MDDDELSPDGRTRVRWAVSDGRMSHIIRTPTIVDAASGETILSCADSGYDAEILWGADGGFDIDLRHYWLPGTLRVSVDRAAGTFQMSRPGDDPQKQPIAGLSAFVEAHFKAAARHAATNATGLTLEERAELQLRGNSRALWAMLLLALGAASWFLIFGR